MLFLFYCDCELFSFLIIIYIGSDEAVFIFNCKYSTLLSLFVLKTILKIKFFTFPVQISKHKIKWWYFS